MIEALGALVTLAQPLVHWLEQRGILEPQPDIEQPTKHVEPPGLEIGI